MTTSGRSRGIRRNAIILILSAVTFLFPTLVRARTPDRAKPAPIRDSGYVSALAAANRFLHAWQAGDLETGIVLLSDRVRHAYSAERLEDFFAGGSDRAYEIARGAGNRARYRFPVVLVMVREKRVQRRFSEIALVDAGKNDWVVDKLP